ncbi:unnamed protein product [Darwinula stevensoni]|uniref:MD-2-related lipid-recognition domain-containing protein n=1 Tax=Darwinula stevensoni TaxID=69355 RepID=A0A7R9AC98_9CRUS|nr:unnamed protein product [Darwinula stevensoni]CAG0900175.1 unnamed protein product [Darwinula stevensoni]
MKAFIVLCCCIATTLATTGWTSCGGTSTNNQLEISGCAQTPCNVAPGDHITITATFTSVEKINSISYCETFAGEVSNKLEPFALIVVAGTELDITQQLGIDSDGCQHLTTGNCPIQNGENLVYHTPATIIDIPGVSGVSQYEA